MDKMIEVRYAGAIVGRSAVVRELDSQGLFLGLTEPMPVGTAITLKIGERTAGAKVTAVSESQELARAGMRVSFADPAAAVLFGAPAGAGESAAAPGRTEAPAREAPSAAPAPPAREEPAAPPAREEPAAPAPVSAQASGHADAPRIVVDASAESAATRAPEEVEATGPPAASGPVHAGEGGGKKHRRNKRR